MKMSDSPNVECQASEYLYMEKGERSTRSVEEARISVAKECIHNTTGRIHIVEGTSRGPFSSQITRVRNAEAYAV